MLFFVGASLAMGLEITVGLDDTVAAWEASPLQTQLLTLLAGLVIVTVLAYLLYNLQETLLKLFAGDWTKVFILDRLEPLFTRAHNKHWSINNTLLTSLATRSGALDAIDYLLKNNGAGLESSLANDEGLSAILHLTDSYFSLASDLVNINKEAVNHVCEKLNLKPWRVGRWSNSKMVAKRSLGNQSRNLQKKLRHRSYLLKTNVQGTQQEQKLCHEYEIAQSVIKLHQKDAKVLGEMLETRLAKQVHHIRSLQWTYYPSSPEQIKPTKIGNILETTTIYFMERYLIDKPILWKHLLHMLEPKTLAKFEETRIALNFLLLMSVFCSSFALVWGLVILLFTNYWALFLLCAVAWYAGRAFYHTATQSALAHAEQIRIIVDLHRDKLLKGWNYTEPFTFENIENERQTWLWLATFLPYGGNPRQKVHDRNQAGQDTENNLAPPPASLSIPPALVGRGIEADIQQEDSEQNKQPDYISNGNALGKMTASQGHAAGYSVGKSTMTVPSYSPAPLSGTSAKPSTSSSPHLSKVSHHPAIGTIAHFVLLAVCALCSFWLANRPISEIFLPQPVPIPVFSKDVSTYVVISDTSAIQSVVIYERDVPSGTVRSADQIINHYTTSHIQAKTPIASSALVQVPLSMLATTTPLSVVSPTGSISATLTPYAPTVTSTAALVFTQPATYKDILNTSPTLTAVPTPTPRYVMNIPKDNIVLSISGNSITTFGGALKAGDVVSLTIVDASSTPKATQNYSPIASPTPLVLDSVVVLDVKGSGNDSVVILSVSGISTYEVIRIKTSTVFITNRLSAP